jgi:hypothetical protein
MFPAGYLGAEAEECHRVPVVLRGGDDRKGDLPERLWHPALVQTRLTVWR